MCFKTAKWKREQTLDHKFDFVEVDLFYERNCLTKVKYSFIFLIVLKSLLVYIADLWSATLLLIFSDGWTSSGLRPTIRLDYARFIYLFSIMCSFLLLAWEANKARAIMRSRDIGLAFTSPFCYRFYVLKSYPHYCFFSRINDSKKTLDDIAFFVFFTLKGWKRILFAEAPRQAVNGFTMYAFLTTNPANPYDRRFNFSRVYQQASVHQNPAQLLALCSMAFAFSVFAVSALLSLLALILYFPLLCVIRGNLKEFCCHKIDKRIGELLRKKSRLRVAREAKLRMLEKGEVLNPDFHLKNSLSLREPTLPSIPPDLEDLYVTEGRPPTYVRGGSGGMMAGDRFAMNVKSHAGVGGGDPRLVPQRSASGATFHSAGSASFASSAPTYFSRQASSVRSNSNIADAISPKTMMDRHARSDSPHSMMERYPSKASSVASSNATVTYASRMAVPLASSNPPMPPGPAHTVQRKPAYTNISPRPKSPYYRTPDEIRVDTEQNESTGHPSSDSDGGASERTKGGSSSPIRRKGSTNEGYSRNAILDETFKSHHIFSPTGATASTHHPFPNTGGSSTRHSMISFSNDASISFSFGNASVVNDTRTTTANTTATVDDDDDDGVSTNSYLSGDPFASVEGSVIHIDLPVAPLTTTARSPTTPTSRFFSRKSSARSSPRRSRFGGRIDGGWNDGEELTPSRYRERKRTVRVPRGEFTVTGYSGNFRFGADGSKNIGLGVNF